MKKIWGGGGGGGGGRGVDEELNNVLLFRSLEKCLQCYVAFIKLYLIDIGA